MYFRKSFFNFIKKYNVLYLNLKQQQQNLHLYYVDKNYISPLILTNVSQYSSDSLSKCWNCNFVYKSDLFCSKCKVLQEPPENLTYFDIIGVPKSYDVKVTEIQKKYKELQKLLHPDKFGTKSEKEKQFSETLSSLVNNAYSTLIHPLKRGLYMLKLNDITISEETDNMNAEFLMEIMEKNEEIEDVGDDVEKIKKLVQENEIMLNNLTKEVADAFRQKNIKKAESLLIRMKYYDSINTKLRKLKHDLGIIE
ncbi:iron-sulfur cluster co-chaperone protein HscB [Bombus vosnesenskii]|uniref:Iron-sulfur cluster co-chaperone protein HscB n=2 Tax=Pyrobombus TaxID=144703 RepID=A0A6J3L852_9HYME|nr:iron-sulfur cluster co-chaperone protein HscB [Bombus vancouverensis nearcticus]XP_033310023.1 iron-sulfur cluster co-chaperone protein HscB [Bombus bifarius]XP_033361803.1 iron-sulfur cluster co-chaperone protein HscB [Bombus vosnesenskii]XP_050481391.1 iron-sulfur cluster co-chaperone protein HscB [Bombus huntii]